jgi:hypothetical protein
MNAKKRTLTTRIMKNMTYEDLAHRLECLRGSAESLDSKSMTSCKIVMLEREIANRGVPIPGKNNCTGSNLRRQPVGE